VTGFAGAAERCPNVKLGIPTVTREGKPLLLQVPGPSILHTGAHGLLLSHGRWQRAGFQITLRPGTTRNPRDGGFIRTPKGHVIDLDFRHDLYYLPVHTAVKAKRANHLRHPRPTTALTPSDNPYQMLQDDERDPSVCNWTMADITTSHQAWCHPAASKYDTIVTTYPELFPKDPSYRAAARQHRCPVCDLMKGQRKYRKSKRMKGKQQKCVRHCRTRNVLETVHIPELPDKPVQVCASHTVPKRVRFSPETSTRSRLPVADDDFLVMVIDGVDFLWAAPSTHKSDPEHLLEEFLRYTNIKISKLRTAGEFASSDSFKRWCANRDIIMCPTAGYNHTMQARAENAVRITKEHIRCMLKHANMPHQFWPWALTQFCRIYNYWPSKGHAPPWVLLSEHRFSQSLHRDLHPFGCKMIGKLPREHPLVTNTTLSDRGLEGAFLGWDLSTPTAWMWSFRQRKPIRIHDPIFYDTLFPFDDPSSQRVTMSKRRTLPPLLPLNRGNLFGSPGPRKLHPFGGDLTYRVGGDYEGAATTRDFQAFHHPARTSSCGPTHVDTRSRCTRFCRSRPSD